MSPFGLKAVAVLAVITAVCVVLSYFMFRRMQQADDRLRKARAAAEEAARAAAMAAPGGIDPEIVLAILNQGMAPTLDNVYQLSQRRTAPAAPARQAAG
jgi:uncharacterized protein (UPF0333 family)